MSVRQTNKRAFLNLWEFKIFLVLKMYIKIIFLYRIGGILFYLFLEIICFIRRFCFVLPNIPGFSEKVTPFSVLHGFGIDFGRISYKQG